MFVALTLQPQKVSFALKVLSNLAEGVADAVRTSLGPRGMDKMISSPSGEVIITNDGATIMDQLQVEHPAAKMVGKPKLEVPKVLRSRWSSCQNRKTSKLVTALLQLLFWRVQCWVPYRHF